MFRRMSEDLVYEMLWDCRYCGSVKLLGKTHRHCPSCGAPQENAPRYFPPEDEKVAVKDHVFVGADRVCPACGNTTSRAAKHCGNCGSPLEGGQGVKLRTDVVHAEGAAYGGETAADAKMDLSGAVRPAPPPPKKSPLKALLLGAVGLGVLGVIAFVLVFFLWKREAGFEVTGHRWTRTIEVEQKRKVEESAWCDELPAGAENVTRKKEKRSTKKVEDGEDCNVRKVDNGDGTYTQKRECTPKYRDEPVMEDRCTFTVQAWRSERTEKASGGLGDAPAWPAVNLAKTGECLGCEREGKRSESYVVTLADPKSGASSECDFDASRWKSMAPKSRWLGKVRALGGALDCDSLRQQ